jgi:hypothetical protein
MTADVILSPCGSYLIAPDGRLWRYNGGGWLRRYHPGTGRLCIDGDAYRRRRAARQRRRQR